MSCPRASTGAQSGSTRRRPASAARQPSPRFPASVHVALIPAPLAISGGAGLACRRGVGWVGAAARNPTCREGDGGAGPCWVTAFGPDPIYAGTRMSQQFASDNNAGMCPEALDAFLRANAEGHATGYGDDAWT